MQLRYWPGLRDQELGFVVFLHTDVSKPHLDLMLELGPERRLWAFRGDLRVPLLSPMLEWMTHGVHDRRYLTFEGLLTRERGRITKIDAGRYRVRLNRARAEIRICGALLTGAYTIYREGRGHHVWKLIPEHLVHH